MIWVKIPSRYVLKRAVIFSYIGDDTMIDRKFESWPSGIIRTKPRERLLLVLENSENPLSAMEIWVEIQKDNHPVSLSTIYRSLEQFVEKGIVTKRTFMNHELVSYELSRPQHNHYAVCLRCRKIWQMEYCPIEQSLPKMVDSDFHVTGHNLEIYGYCKECNNHSPAVDV